MSAPASKSVPTRSPGSTSTPGGSTPSTARTGKGPRQGLQGPVRRRRLALEEDLPGGREEGRRRVLHHRAGRQRLFVDRYSRALPEVVPQDPRLIRSGAGSQPARGIHASQWPPEGRPTTGGLSHSGCIFSGIGCKLTLESETERLVVIAMRKILVYAFLLLALSSVVANAQDSRGAIVGRITDASGAVVPGADVRATNAATGVVASSKTNESGNYTLPYLMPGIYSVSSEATGFKKFVRENIQVRITDSVELNIQMAVGDVTESVEVTAETPLLQTAEASLGQVVDERRVLELPAVLRQRHGARAAGARHRQRHRHAPAQGRRSTTLRRSSRPTARALFQQRIHHRRRVQHLFRRHQRARRLLAAAGCPSPSSKCRPRPSTPASATPSGRWSTSAPRAAPTTFTAARGGGCGTRNWIRPPFSRTAPARSCPSTRTTATAWPAAGRS